jgi:hypothetical protein
MLSARRGRRAPAPVFTSRRMALGFSAIFLLMMEATMSGGLSVVAVWSRRA